MQLTYPLTKIKITQYFGERPEVYKPFAGHNGIDLCTIYPDSPNGKRPVLTAGVGVVSEIGDQGTKGYRKFIRLRHTDGSETLYAHLCEFLIQIKQSVLANEQIGISDNTGFSTAPHLHFAYRPANYNAKNGYNGYVDPLPFLEEDFTPPKPLFAEPLTLLKRKDQSAIYIFGHDNLWHGLESMEVLKTLKGSFAPDQVITVDHLPGNIGSTIGKK